MRQNVPGTSAADPRWKFAAEGERGALAFDDKQLYAKALAYFEPLLDGAKGGLARRVLRKLDEEVNSGGTAKVICPELIMRAFNQGVDALPITTLNQSWTSPRCSANAGPRQCPER